MSIKKQYLKSKPICKVTFSIDPEMINGIQITDNDREFEINLNRTFNDIINHLSRYD